MATKRENDVLKEKCSVFWDNYFLHFAFLYFPNFCFLKEKKKDVFIGIIWKAQLQRERGFPSTGSLLQQLGLGQVEARS